MIAPLLGVPSFLAEAEGDGMGRPRRFDLKEMYQKVEYDGIGTEWYRMGGARCDGLGCCCSHAFSGSAFAAGDTGLYIYIFSYQTVNGRLPQSFKNRRASKRKNI